MLLLRTVIGETLRARRLGQRRTLREVSSDARVSLGYLSEIERGQKEASSELLAAICGALGVPLSDVLNDVRDTFRMDESAGLPDLDAADLDSDLGADLASAGGPPVSLQGRVVVAA